MRKSFNRALHALICVFALLALPLPSLADGDDTNAAKITDLSLWADMYQVMSGTSIKTPDELQKPLKIRTPKGIYAYVIVGQHLLDVANHSGVGQEQALKNYFTFLLSQQEIAGILFAAPWSLLNPHDPKTNPESVAYELTSLKAAFEAIESYNQTSGQPAKNLQLNVTAGFNAPPWLFDTYLPSCDALFSQLNLTSPIPCGYTEIFIQTEVAASQVGPAKLPLPWDKTYHAQWRGFLQYLWGTYLKENDWQKDVVSVAVSGPTASSSEIWLPNEDDQQPYTPLLLPAASRFTLPPPTNQNIDAHSAWNCLLANNYGFDSSYLNSDRAFVEEWANAIDMFGQIFSGLTLVVTTGNHLPNFNLAADVNKPEETSLSGCGLSGKITLPDKSTADYLKLLKPHPAFESDCGPDPLRPMDCPAEVAILAYFAEPPVGGPNAKATQENALTASDDKVDTLKSLSNASVKWLAKFSEGLILTGPQPGGAIGLPLVSRVLGGLQFGHAASTSPHEAAKQGCPEGPTSPTSDKCNRDDSHSSDYTITTEEAINNTLGVFFAGTSGGGASAFGAPSAVANNDRPIKDAPLDYLQIWEADIVYASGCTMTDAMTNPGCKSKTPPPTQDLLVRASNHIPTTDPVNLPLFGYNKCSKKDEVPSCKSGYHKREAFKGDLVCVSERDKNQAETENDNYASNFATNENDSSKSGIAYGRCKSNLTWRQAYMGDYVCVSLLPEDETILADNENYFFGIGVDCH